MALGSIISSHVIRESLRYCAGGRGIRTGDIHLRRCDSLHARSCTCSRFACGVSPSGVLALSRTFGTPCASAPIPIPPSVMARWLCLTTGGTQPSNGNLGPPSLSPGRPARFSTSWNGRAGWLSDGLSSLRETLPDNPKRGFRSGRLGPGRSDPFFVTVCVSAWWLLSLLTSVSGRLPKRLKGPGRFRFIFQPAIAMFFGIRAGISDARSRREPFVFGVLFDSQRRRALLKEAFERLSVLIAMSILLDALSQFLILHEVFPGPALIVGPVLIAMPYSLTRALTNRIVRHSR